MSRGEAHPTHYQQKILQRRMKCVKLGVSLCDKQTQSSWSRWNTETSRRSSTSFKPLAPLPLSPESHTGKPTNTAQSAVCTVALRERLCENTVPHCVCVTVSVRARAHLCESVCRCICICLCMLQRVNLTLQSDDSATVQYDAQMCQVRSYLFGWRFHHSYQ